MWRFWSDLATVQADLNLLLAHMSEGTFSCVVAQLYILFAAATMVSAIIAEAENGVYEGRPSIIENLRIQC